eukprot:3032078-Rhodomonas_salina.2
MRTRTLLPAALGRKAASSAVASCHSVSQAVQRSVADCLDEQHCVASCLDEKLLAVPWQAVVPCRKLCSTV